MGREARDVLSYRYATSPASSHAGYFTTTLLVSRAIGALTACGPFASHSNGDAAGHNGPGRQLTSISAGQGLCGAPRRNRTADPILTMYPRPTAMLSNVFPGRRRP